MASLQGAVLVIDDEAHIRRFVRTGFELEGFAVREAENASAGLRSAALEPPDLIILDLCLPDMHGSEVLAHVRARSNVPVIALSIEADEAEKVRMLNLGADDYVVKPCGIGELLARARANMRRALPARNKLSLIRSGPLTIDLEARRVMLDGTRVRLTRKEFSLLRVLALQSGEAVTQQQLLTDVWGEEHVNKSQYLRVLVRQVRGKIEKDPANPKVLTTESGIGYRLEASSTQE
ncbi:MAG: response regulator [Xanthobacteraceae bacterium]|nr:response regulator [Xanthobacteraceae bacterium]MBV9235657.1 response regulator [Xanthobacteraceae bacterium]MBV9632643.1 response regulator [Xanthobacteraceae bacterium]